MAMVCAGFIAAGVACSPIVDKTDDELAMYEIDTSNAQELLLDGWPELTSIDVTPAFVFGGEAEPSGSPLFRVTDILPRPDGGIYVANSGGYEIVAVAADAAVEWRVGGAGDGPGEFRSVSFLHSWRADTIVALDTRLGRASFVTPAGRVERTRDAGTVTPEPSSDKRILVQSFLSGTLYDGRLAVRGPESVTLVGGPGLRRHRTRVTLVDEVGNQETVLELPGPWWYELAIPGVLPATVTPMSGGAPLAFDASGVVWARSDRPEVFLFDSRGAATHIVRIRVPADPLTRTIRRSYLDEWTPQFPIDEQLPFPSDEMPFFDGVFRSTTGDIWARRYDWRRDLQSDVAEEWIRLDIESGSFARYLFPARVKVLDATINTAFGVATDSLGVETVVGFRVPL